MDWKFVLILSLITMAIDSSLAKRRKVNRTETLSPECSKCLDEIYDENPDGSGPANGNRHEPHSVPLRTTKNLSSSCVSCIKFMKTKGKRMGRYKVNKNRSKNPKHGKYFSPDFQDWFKSVFGMKQFSPGQAPAPDRGTNIHYHFHISKNGSPETSDSTINLETDESGSEMARSNFEINAPAENETTQVSEETTQSSSETSAAGNETTQNGGDTTQSSSEVSATSDEATQVTGETTQSSSEVSTAGDETTQVSGETTQSISEVSAAGDETTQEDGGQPNKESVLALAVAFVVPALLGSRANVNYDYA